MSRSYRHRTKSGKIDSYLKQMFAPSAFRAKFLDESDQKDLEANVLGYRIGKYEEAVPKGFRKMLNRAKKNQDKTRLFYALKNDTLDNLSYPRWPKDAGYIYW